MRKIVCAITYRIVIRKVSVKEDSTNGVSLSRYQRKASIAGKHPRDKTPSSRPKHRDEAPNGKSSRTSTNQLKTQTKVAKIYLSK